jgi:hypothetical protein
VAPAVRRAWSIMARKAARSSRGWRRSPHLRTLKVLRLHYSLDSTDVGLALADTPAWTGLRELDLSTGILTGEALAGLARNPALAGLEVLDIGRSRGSGPARVTAFARAGGLPGLRVLRVDQVSLRDAELTVIAGARQWSGLRELDLSGNQIGPAGAKALALATHMSALERLDLDGNRLGPHDCHRRRVRSGTCGRPTRRLPRNASSTTSHRRHSSRATKPGSTCHTARHAAHRYRRISSVLSSSPASIRMRRPWPCSRRHPHCSHNAGRYPSTVAIRCRCVSQSITSSAIFVPPR